MRVILASASPRRVDLLKKIYAQFDVRPADVDEKSIEAGLDGSDCKDMIEYGEKLVLALSRAKADSVYRAEGCPADTLVIGADTIVAVDDEIFEKPVDRDDAVRMLRKESQKKQQVLTGVCFIKDGRYHSFTESTLVVFNKLDEVQERLIQEYCDTDEPYDKSGSYGIQVIGDKMVDYIEGSIDNVVGFPAERAKAELELFLK